MILFSRSSEKSFSLHSFQLCVIRRVSTIRPIHDVLPRERYLKEQLTSFLRDYPRAMEIPGTRQGWHDFETGRTGFRRPHYKWPIRRRFPNELLKRTPRLLRIFKLGRYFQLACIWYRQPNRTPRFHPPVPHPLSFFSSLFFFNRLPPPHPIPRWKKKKPRIDSPSSSYRSSFSSFHTEFFLSFFFFLFLFFFPPVFQSVQRVVSFAPITRHRAIPYPEGDRNGKILSAPVTCKCGNVFRHYGMYYSKNRSHWPRIAIRSWSTMASKRRGFPFLWK